MDREIRPNTLAAPWERAALQRVEALFRRLDRLPVADLLLATVSPAAEPVRRTSLAGLEGAASQHGRGGLLDEARSAVRDRILARIAAIYPIDGGTGVPSLRSRAEDEARLVLALQDAVAVAIAQDLIDAEDADLLAGPARRLLGIRPGPVRERGAADGQPDEPAPGTAWMPSEQDWEAAATGREAAVRDAPLPGVVGMRVGFFALVALIGAPAALGAGIAAGQPLLAVLVAAAVIALCWTFATYRSSR